ncbi:hypothetical protein [Azospirillum sp. INR13]|uniref:hypothetical protein n=1 Tax=Azospirillum sp. INR13 TaxID=2596919 RepID=UPI0018920A77|nr:hypothetical protein [Azospirillum sp. INR13]
MPLPPKTFSKRLAKGLSVLVVLAGTSGAAQADKSLVYCTEGNPQSFNAQVSTSGTSVNAASPLFNNLVEFGRGTQIITPALAESYTVFRRWSGLRFPFAPERPVSFQRAFYAQPDAQCR